MVTGAQITARTCGLAGTVLTGLPLLAPIVLAAILAVSVGGFHFDFLMPGELFAFAAVGGILLLVAAFVTRHLVAVVAVLAGATLVLFLSVGWVAGATGLASGHAAAVGWPMGVVSTLYAAYVAALVALFVFGILLCRAMFARRLPDAASDADM